MTAGVVTEGVVGVDITVVGGVCGVVAASDPTAVDAGWAAASEKRQ